MRRLKTFSRNAVTGSLAGTAFVVAMLVTAEAQEIEGNFRQQEAGAAREQLAAGVKGVDSLLTELSRSEDRMAELLLAEDAAAAVKELRDVVGAISKTIETIRSRVREQFGSAGA